MQSRQLHGEIIDYIEPISIRHTAKVEFVEKVLTLCKIPGCACASAA